MSPAGTPLTLQEAIIGVVAACFALLQFSTAWDFLVKMDAENEDSEKRKAPSRWGAVFVREPDASGVTDAGNAFYLYVIRALEHCAALLSMPNTPLKRLSGKSNLKKVSERAGDLVEAVIGAPLRRRHLEDGGIDTGYSN